MCADEFNGSPRYARDDVDLIIQEEYNHDMSRVFDTDNFITAWILAPIISVSPWFLIFSIFIIALPGVAASTFAILYTGVVLFGIPFTLLMERRQSRIRWNYLVVGAITGQLTPIVTAIIDKTTPLYRWMGIEEIDAFSLSFGLLFGSIHGLMCAYIYHKIVYGYNPSSG